MAGGPGAHGAEGIKAAIRAGALGCSLSGSGPSLFAWCAGAPAGELIRDRMIEAFAFLTARVRLKLEDEFPELTDALLSVIYPHYLAPVPSMAVLQFQADLCTVHLRTTAPRAACPVCAHPSNTVHSRYRRAIRDGATQFDGLM